MSPQHAATTLGALALTLATACEGGGAPHAATAASSTADASLDASASSADSTLPQRAADQPPGALTVAEIQDQFEADDRTLLGNKVKVYGRYHSVSRATTDAGTTFRINIVDDANRPRPAVPCQLDSEPADLKRGDKLIAEGTVEKLFGASLKDCSYRKL